MRRLSGLAAVLLVILVTACGTTGDSLRSSGMTEKIESGSAWESLRGDRLRVLRSLAEPVLVCVARSDTTHTAFHGCVDWHSAVHGTFALLATHRLTGDPHYRDAALAAVGGDDRLAAEAATVAAGGLPEEEPYGFAWALLLDVEAALGDLTQFHRVGTAARDRLVEYLARQSGEALTSASQEPDYASSIWPTYTLLRWGRAFDDAVAVATAADAARQILAPENISALCRPDLLAATGEFFSPCHLAVLLGQVAQTDCLVLEPALAAVRETVPLASSQMRTAHSAGLNFSRAWGVHAAARITGDADLYDTFAQLMTTQLAMPERWRSDYRRYAHWVAQFGVFALSLTFGPRPVRKPEPT